MKPYDVIIIGAGVVGTAIARELSHYKLSVAVLEKEEEPSFGVSKSNSGIIHPGTQNPPGSLKGRLAVLGNYLMRKIASQLGIDFKEVGELIVAFNEKQVQRLQKLKNDAEIIGVPKLQIVDKTWLQKNEPNLNKKALAALYAPTAGVISPYRLVYDLSENAIRNGVEIYTNAKVENIIPNISNKGHRNGFWIYTTLGIFEAKYCINASGLYTDDISSMLGINNFQIRPRKGEAFLLDKKLENTTNHLLFPLPSRTSKGVLVTRTADGNPMIGPTAELVNSKEDLITTDKGFNKVLRGAKKLIPSLDGKDIIAYFAGLRPVAKNDFIIRHEEKAPGFINVAGIQSPGLTAAPAIALFVCNILKKSGLTLEKKRIFHKHRNKTIHLFSIPLSLTKALVKKDPAYGDIICRCEMISLKEITDAIKRGAKTLDGIKFRTRAQAGRCHGSFCTPRLLKILSKEMNTLPTHITKRGKGSEIIKGMRGND